MQSQREKENSEKKRVNITQRLERPPEWSVPKWKLVIRNRKSAVAVPLMFHTAENCVRGFQGDSWRASK